MKTFALHVKTHIVIYLILLFQLLLYWLINSNITLPISGALYWDYSRHLQAAYLDSPYMLPLIIKMYSLLFGTSALAFGFIKFIFITAITGLMYSISYPLYGRKAAIYSVLFFLILPAHNVFYQHLNYHLSVILLIPCLLLCLTKWQQTQSRVYIYLGGLCLGGLLMTEFESIFFVFSFALALWLVKSYRTLWKRFDLYIALIIAGLFLIPFIHWQWLQNWLTFKFLSGSHPTHYTLSGFFNALLDYIGSLNFFFIILPFILFKYKRLKTIDSNSLFFLYSWLFSVLLVNFVFMNGANGSIRHTVLAGSNICLLLFLAKPMITWFPRYTLFTLIFVGIINFIYSPLTLYLKYQNNILSFVPQIQKIIKPNTLIISNVNPKDLAPAWFSIHLNNQPPVYALQPDKLMTTHQNNPDVYIWQPPLSMLIMEKTWDHALILTNSPQLPPPLQSYLRCYTNRILKTNLYIADSIKQLLAQGTKKKTIQIYAHQCIINKENNKRDNPNA